MEFVHLQVKSSYTLLESTITIDRLISAAKERGYRAVALTDRNVLYGALEFYQKAKKENIKPLIGLTLDMESVSRPGETYPLIFLAKSVTGYRQLIQLSSKYMIEKKPVPLEFAGRYQSDMFVITPGMEGEVETLLLQQQKTQAEQVLNIYKNHFTDLYIGIQVENELLPIKKQLLDLDADPAALGNVEYIDKDDAFANEVLKSIKENEELAVDTTPAADRSLRGNKQMKRNFEEEGLGAAVENALEISRKIDIQFNLDEQLLPKFPVPQPYEKEEYLKELCFEGLEKKLPNAPNDYRKRLEKELEVISKMGFSDYFLIVWDVMKYAHNQKIVTGSGRGSAAASLAAYCLNITDVDPLEYNLLFERFLNEERYTMPDIDLDFPDNKRDEILSYVNNKYGGEHVAQIATFGTYAAKMSVRDAGRVLGIDKDELKRWSNAVPNTLKITLSEAYKESDNLRKLVAESEKNKRIFAIAKRIEGLPRHVSTHAAGVVISDRPLLERIPLEEGSGELLLTQFTMDNVEKSGLLKMDFLALKNLTILADCIYYSKYENSGKPVNTKEIPLDDEKTLNLFRNGDTNGIFQFESPGIKRVLKRISPSSIEDVIAVNALYRPGPMEQIDSFIKRKKGQEPILYPHDDLKSILEVTYGIMVYQEQVMQVAAKMAGYSLSEADQLRRTMSKKIHEEMEAGRKKFVKGSIDKGYSEQTASSVYDYIDRFANYGFNRAHAAAYSMVAYQLAYFKANYPLSFFASLLKNYSNNKAKVKLFSSEAKKRGIKFIGPDINQSEFSFTVKNKAIQFGLSQVISVNSKLIRAILSERKNNGRYQNLTNFAERLTDSVSKPENVLPFIYAGAFDSITPNRATAVKSLDSVFESIEKSGGNIELFELTKPRLQQVGEYSLEEKLDQEFNYTGFYFSSHPSSQFDDMRNPHNISYINQLEENKPQRILGSVRSVKTIQTKKGVPMSFVTVSDETGTISLTLFPEEHRKFIRLVQEGSIIFVEGKIEKYKDDFNFIAKKVMPAEELEEDWVKQILFLRFDSLDGQKELFTQVQELLTRYSGSVPVVVYESSKDQHRTLKESYNIEGKKELLEKLQHILGNGNVVLK